MTLCCVHPAGPPQIQKSASHYTEAARDEITLLAQLRAGDPADDGHCVRLLDHFEHAGPHGRHVCMVFEVCAPPAPDSACMQRHPLCPTVMCRAACNWYRH